MATKQMGKEELYTSSDIQVLEGMEAVRKRPGMYIGSTDKRGLHHLIYEIVDNGVDEFMASRGDRVTIHIREDGSVRVQDYGGGIPVDTHKATGVSGVETVMTTLHAGGKFGGKAYTVSGGLHGVGASVVNALSSWFRVEVRRYGKLYHQEFSSGKKTTALLEEALEDAKDKKSGTVVIFEPDRTIFPEVEYDFNTLSQRFKEMAFLNKGLRIDFRSDWEPAPVSVETGFEEEEENEDWDDDEVDAGQTVAEQPAIDALKPAREVSFCFQGGISEFVTTLNATRTVLHEPPIYVEKQVDGTKVEVAMQYHDAFTESVFVFANCINTTDGGTHLTGFRSALTRIINDYAKKNEYIKNGNSNLSGEDTREGLTAIVSVKLTDPQFEGQTKTKLGNPEVRNQVETVVAEALQVFLEDHPKDSRRIIEKCLTSQRAREAARKARDMIIRKNAMDGGSLPGKLADCSDKNPENCELYLVEGESAGGTAKMGRDRVFQAILPLKGKILNVEKAREEKMLANDEIRALTIAVGAGIGEDFDVEKLRYHRIIIMTDADVDGSHIRTLLLTFFFRYMKELITNGNLYMALPPLYGITRGKQHQWAYSEADREEALKGFGGKTKPSIQRYKGLGEMSADQLWETTMDPEYRTLLQVAQGDAASADEIFSMLMGDIVEPRRNFIQTNALDVKDLDV
jgi:DNA gyrase subunit B